MSKKQIKQELFSFIFPAVSKKERQSRSNSAERTPRKSRSRSRSRERKFKYQRPQVKRISTTNYFNLLEKQFAKNQFLTRLLIKLEGELNAIYREREVIESSIELIQYISQKNGGGQKPNRLSENQKKIQILPASSNGGQNEEEQSNDEDQARLANFAELYGRSQDLAQ